MYVVDILMISIDRNDQYNYGLVLTPLWQEVQRWSDVCMGLKSYGIDQDRSISCKRCTYGKSWCVSRCIRRSPFICMSLITMLLAKNVVWKCLKKDNDVYPICKYSWKPNKHYVRYMDWSRFVVGQLSWFWSNLGFLWHKMSFEVFNINCLVHAVVWWKVLVIF